VTQEATPAAPAVETPAADDSSSPVVEPVSDAPSGEIPAEAPAADPADPVSDAPADDEQPVQGGRKSRAQERIEELAQTNKYLREHNEFLREHLAKLTPSQPAAPAPADASAEQPAAPADEPMPTLESCGFDSTVHAQKVAEWVKKQVEQGVQTGVKRELSARESQAAAQSQEQTIVAAAAEFRKEHPDFDVVVGNPRLQWTQTVMDALREAGADSPALGYHLASNPDKLARIAKMPPKQQLLELGKIQGTLTGNKPAPTPPPPAPPRSNGTPPAPKQPATPPAAAAKRPATTNAPPPPTPVSGQASPEVDPLKMSGSEWAKWRRQQLADRQKSKPGSALRP
jgi:hypothetical protein